jgi:hypothetical protein
LRTLSLKQNEIQCTGVIALAQALRNHPLERLILNQNRIGNSGVLELARVLQDDSTLKELDLYRNYIQTEAAEALLLAMQQNVTIQKLEVSCNCIADIAVTRQIRFHGKLNKAGRYLLRIPHVPIALWPMVLARVNYEPQIRFYFLREKPELFQYYR